MKNISNSRPEDRLIFALDAPGVEEASSWIDRLSGSVGLFKVGKELFTSAGPSIVERVLQKGGRVFLDLKFHDIPNTVARAGEAATALKVDMFNVHASGGSRMIKPSSRELCRKKNIERPAVLAVRCDQFERSDLAEIGLKKRRAICSHLKWPVRPDRVWWLRQGYYAEAKLGTFSIVTRHPRIR